MIPLRVLLNANNWCVIATVQLSDRKCQFSQSVTGSGKAKVRPLSLIALVDTSAQWVAPWFYGQRERVEKILPVCSDFALLSHGNVNDFAGRDAVDCRPNLVRRTFQQSQLEPRRDDHDDAHPKRRELLLVLDSSVCGEKHIKATLGAPQEIAVRKRTPTFLLNGTDLNLGKLPSKQPRHVLVEQDPFHAIFATSA